MQIIDLPSGPMPPKELLVKTMNPITCFLSAGLCALCLHAAAAQGPAEPPQPDTSAPLGSRENPVRANMPSGERDFLMRLRCPEGDAPAFERGGSIGIGPYHNVLDIYDVSCASGRKSTVVIDMYHKHRETANIAGFTTLAEHPGRLAQGCPPKVDGADSGEYVFHMLEVERPAHIADITRELESDSVSGYAYTRFVIGKDGKVAPQSIDFPNPHQDPRLNGVVADYLATLQFTPAEHHAGCNVAQKAEIAFKINKK